MNISEVKDSILNYAQKNNKKANTYHKISEDMGYAYYTAPSAIESNIYNPITCLILQGKKNFIQSDQVIEFGAGESLIVGHDLPVTAQIMDASPEKPYVTMVIFLDLDIIRSLYGQMDLPIYAEKEGKPLNTHIADPVLIDVLGRYFKMAQNPEEMKILGPLLRQEIHYRLLTAPHGSVLRDYLARDSHATRIAKAIEVIRQNFKESLSIPEVASHAGVSASSFHEHFKSATGTTPLQYQKELRLMEARQILLSGNNSVTSTAFRVGYESANQFSREYSRKFGVAPSHDLKANTLESVPAE